MKTLKTISLCLFVALLIVLPAFAFAQASPNKVNVRIENPFNGGSDVMSLITAILQKIVMPIAAVGVVVYIIWAGFTYVLAQGNPKKIAEANQRLLWSLIGAGILLGAAAISQVVELTVKALVKTS